jgi:5'-nucleotidase
MRPTILVTNDDGVHSAGLLALKQGLARLGQVMVLAPDHNWSASSHAKTMHIPLRIAEVRLADGSVAYAATGSPTDCVALAAGGALTAVPDLVVSGINFGYNLGVDITYSGTVACAMEAVIKRIPGIAVSGPFGHEEGIDLSAIHARAAEIACELGGLVLSKRTPDGTLLNVNVPPLAPAEWRGVHVTRMGSRHYPAAGDMVERRDPAGRPYYWLGGTGPIDRHDDGTDLWAVKHGYVSVTPITLDMTDHAFLAELAGWSPRWVAAARVVS